MNTKLFILLFSSFLLEATAAGLNHYRGPNQRQEFRRPDPQNLDKRRNHEVGDDNLDLEARLAAQAFRVSEDSCPALSSMPDCGATCINSVAPAQGCPVAGDISCNCKNSKQIQSAAQDCVLSLCGPITAMSVIRAASEICDQCVAAPTTDAAAAAAAAEEVTNKRLPRLGNRAEQGTKTVNMRAAAFPALAGIPERRVAAWPTWSPDPKAVEIGAAFSGVRQIVDEPWFAGKAEATKRPAPDEDAEIGQAGKRQD